jgi:hypothetical protein
MLRLNILKTIIAAGALALSFTSAQAVPVTFTFGGSSTATSFTDLATGLTLNVTSGGFNQTGDYKTLFSAGTVTTQALGLGVDLNTATGGAPPATVNSSGTFREALTFSFGQSVKLLSVGFANMFFGANQNGPVVVFEQVGANLEADAGSNLLQGPDSFDPTGAFSTVNATSSLDLSAESYLGSLFAIGAKGGTSFYVSSITVDIPAVPVPAAGLLLGSILFVPLLRRKRRS